MRLSILTAIALACGANLIPTAGHACPFCTAVSQTFSEEIAAMDVVVIARLLQAPPPPSDSGTDSDAPLPKAKFQVDRVLKGDSLVGESEVLELLWGGVETLLVISSDLSHYQDYDTARRHDRATSEAIEALAPQRIHYEDACGRNPVNGLLLAARRRG